MNVNVFGIVTTRNRPVLLRMLSPALSLPVLAWFGMIHAQEAPSTDGRPNFLVIVADDMGWSDIGVLGGEIRTPTIDALARRGTVLTDYYVAPTCAPTRSMLMTGVDNHQAGLGVQSGMRAPNQVGINYQGQLHHGVVTVAEALSASGYQTFMAGKWHLSGTAEQAPGNRGFQRSFALLNGAASHFADRLLITPAEPVQVVFFSDNCASSPGPMVYPGVTRTWLAENWDRTHTDPGGPRSFTTLGREWASAAVTPWKLYKNTVSEGGIRSPLIISGPGVAAGEFSNALAHVTDIVPTVYELAGIEPGSDPLFEDKVHPQGMSLMPVLTAQAASGRASTGVHLFGNRGFRRDRWKISNTQPPLSNGEWELFDLSRDPGEVNDLAGERPDLLNELLSGFEQYLDTHEVILPSESPLGAGLRELHSGECNWWCEARFAVIGWLD